MAIIQAEEINPNTLNREDGLKLLGREPLTVEKKHGSSNRSIIRGRQIYTSNDMNDLEEDLNGALSKTLDKKYIAFENRIVKMKFDSLKDVIIDATNDINGETAMTILMCGYYYYDLKYNDGNKGYIEETLKQYSDVSEIEDQIQGELDKYNGYYRVGSGKPKSAKKCENIDGMMTPPRSISPKPISPPRSISPKPISPPRSISPKPISSPRSISQRETFSPRSPRRSFSPRSLSPRSPRRSFSPRSLSPRSPRRSIYPHIILSPEDGLY